MSSYGSNHSHHLHPSHYPPNPQTQQMPSQQPYPTTPRPAPTLQPQAFYAPTTHHHHHQQTHPSPPSTPMSIPTPRPPSNRHATSAHAQNFARPPSYARSHSHASHHAPQTRADAEDSEQSLVLDGDTLRQYERRYAKDRELEKRPTLGGSVMSVIRALGGRRV
ncbi:hypothetical protein BDU57DRAFT_207061 [Ampelomyces quisqualis]|uniref:Uncharacterized protein n=1 Tax=Ampelomyces quisqualis TaxID=50730 RepID=A0A6A5QJC1_AMPQU|nr:hypothetical protein BDU57DRAFT_207061 [Ampelomyces quisqualis]